MSIDTKNENMFRRIVEHSLDIVTLIDAAGKILYSSPALTQQLGYEAAEVEGKRFLHFVHEHDRAHVEKQMTVTTTGETVNFCLVHKDGRMRFFEATVANLLNNKDVGAIIINSRDVTESMEAAEEMEQYRSHLEQLVDQRAHELTEALDKEKAALQQQMRFVSMVSHEFRTPLTIIDGNAQIIEKRGQTLEPDVLQRRANTIRKAVDRLVTLIETILSQNMLESGRLTVNLAPCDLMPIIRDVCVDRLGVSPNHTIRLDVAKGLPKMMLDEKVIHQIMVNLVSNAIKYSPKSDLVEVKAHQDGAQVVISVRDHGLGIPENELPKIFTRYFRASTSSGISGSGLGLSLVKDFVELHHGTIGIESTVGVGTTITVKLPIITG